VLYIVVVSCLKSAIYMRLRTCEHRFLGDPVLIIDSGPVTDQTQDPSVSSPTL